MKHVTAVVIGAGSRGTNAYINKAIPGTLCIKAVAEPDDIRRNNIKNTYGIPEENCFKSYEELFAKPKMADLAIICTNDRMHMEPAEMAVLKGYHILIEKPLSPIPADVYKIGRLAKDYDKVFSVCHVLRYTRFYSLLKNILDSGKIGQIVSVIHSEDVGYWHQAHSFVRGNWGNSEKTSPMILQKCCHDMDILSYLIGSKCKKISSFGGLMHFKAENAPKGAAKRCLDGCPHFYTCHFNAAKLYIESSLRKWTPVPFNIPNTESETIINALKHNDYGRCVYYCDNDVVDHQVVNMEFENAVTVAFSMCAFTKKNTRVTRFLGVDGEIEADMGNNLIKICDFKTGNIEEIAVATDESGHGGGDRGIMNSVINAVLGNGDDKSPANEAVHSHMIAFAAEKSRLEGRVIDLDDYVEEIAKSID